MSVYKTTITLTVLHEDPHEIGTMRLSDILRECNEGDFVGRAHCSPTVHVPPQHVYQELLDIGNDGTFFDDSEPTSDISTGDEGIVWCRFRPQLWVRDQCMDADPEGPDKFVVPKSTALEIARMQQEQGVSSIIWDDLKPYAADWAAGWEGPFEIEVEGENELLEELERTQS